MSFQKSKALKYIIIIKIFFRIPGLRRIDAAKELFNAFVTRTQAYKLHHSFGLTLFSTLITVKLNITKNVEEFEVSCYYRILQ